MSVSSIVASLIAERVPKVLPLLGKVAADLHARPEIRFEEVYAASRLSGVLEDEGFEVQRGFGGLPTAFVARWSTDSATPDSPTLAIFCEYDALEEIGHACGHNLIAACGLGAGLVAQAELRDVGSAQAHLVVIGSPAEEGAAGKVPMIEAGVLDGVDAAVMVHPAGDDSIGGTSLSRAALDVTFHGRASHAAAAPELGINALDAATLSLTAVGLLRQQLTDDVRIHGIIQDGGQAPNIIPERTQLRCFVRAADSERLVNDVLPRVVRCFEGAAVATGCEYEVGESTPRYMSLVSNTVLTEMADDAFRAVGRIPRNAAAGTGSGSTDMGNVSREVPAIHPMIGLEAGLTPHTRAFAEAAGDPSRARAVIADGSAILAGIVVQLAHDSSLRDQARMEFEEWEAVNVLSASS